MKYIFLDIDGTLYSNEINGIPSSARKALKLARQNHVKIFLCTGRSLGECVKYLNYDVDGFVFGAGGMVYAEGNRIFNHPIPKKDVNHLKCLISELDMGYSCEGAAGAYCNDFGFENVITYFAGQEKDPKLQLRQAMENCFFHEIHQHEDEQIYKICTYARRGTDFKKLQERLPDPYILTISLKAESGEDCVAELTDYNINKATGIQKVMEFYQADIKDAIGIGDSGNDIPMLKACGYGIAMGNAFDELKEIADFVTTDILDDGIWNAFCHLGIIKEEE